jgi:hypothetical protein
MPFVNKRTNAKAAELRGYDSESEADAKRRLEAAGWDFGGVEYNFDETSKLFATDAIDTKKERQKAFSSEKGESDE